MLRFAPLTPALLALSLGCSGISRELVCEEDEECVREGVTGVCMPPGHCAFRDGTCSSGYRWDSTAGGSRAEKCVGDTGADADPSAPDGSGQVNACGGTAVLEGAPQSACGPCDTGLYECAGPDAVECVGAASSSAPIAGDYESLSASSTYNGNFLPEKSVDGDFTTAWFSAGPEPMAQPTAYTWIGTGEECIEEVRLVGNGQTAFPEGYGFGQVTIEIYDAEGDLQYSDTFVGPGDEAPNVTAEVGGVLGKHVNLLLSGHQADDCGGFSELFVNALR